MRDTTHHDQIVALPRRDVIRPVALRPQVCDSPALDMTVLATELSVSCRADTTTKRQARSFEFPAQTDIERHIGIVCVPVIPNVKQHIQALPAA